MTLPSKTVRQIEAALARAVGENEPGIAVGVAQGGRMVWGGARGLANLNSQEAFSTKTPFRICSISKQFSCALVMREVATGRIDLAKGARVDLTPNRSIHGHFQPFMPENARHY